MIINRLDFIERLQIDPDSLELWLQQEWLLPNLDWPDMEFSEIDLAGATFILDLQQALGVNDEGVGIILHLVDQMHGLRRVLRSFVPENPRIEVA